MLNEIRSINNIIQYLQDREDEITDTEKEGYAKALFFVNDLLLDTQEELEFEYGDSKYGCSESYYHF